MSDFLNKQKIIWYNGARVPKQYNESEENKIVLKPSPKDEQVFKEINNIKDNINDFVSRGGCLYIWSNYVGNGKTTLAVKLLKAYIHSIDKLPLEFENYRPALFVNVSEFLDLSKRAIRDKSLEKELVDIENQIYSADLVIFDDIADKTISEYDMNKLYCWINYRTSNLKSCIYTSNMGPDELDSCMISKLADRITSLSLCKQIKSEYTRRRELQLDYAVTSTK